MRELNDYKPTIQRLERKTRKRDRQAPKADSENYSKRQEQGDIKFMKKIDNVAGPKSINQSSIKLLS